MGDPVNSCTVERIMKSLQTTSQLHYMASTCEGWSLEDRLIIVVLAVRGAIQDDYSDGDMFSADIVLTVKCGTV
jgi:hypothetical protein